MSRKIFLISFFEKSQSCACGGEGERGGGHGLITAPTGDRPNLLIYKGLFLRKLARKLTEN